MTTLYFPNFHHHSEISNWNNFNVFLSADSPNLVEKPRLIIIK